MAMLAAIAGWLGRVLAPILAAVLPELIEQWKKPRNVHVHGGDREVRDDIAKQIEEDSLRGIGGTRIGPGTQDQANRSSRTGA